MKLSFLWEMGHFSDLLRSVYLGTQKSFEKIIQPQTAGVFTCCCFRGINQAPRNCVAGHLPIPSGTRIPSYQLLFVSSFYRRSQKHRGMPGSTEGEDKYGKRARIPITSGLPPFPGFIKARKYSQGFFFHHFQSKQTNKILLTSNLRY